MLMSLFLIFAYAVKVVSSLVTTTFWGFFLPFPPSRGMFCCYFCSLSLLGFFQSDSPSLAFCCLCHPRWCWKMMSPFHTLSYGKNWKFASHFLSLRAGSFLSVSLEIKLFFSDSSDSCLFLCSDPIPASCSSGWSNPKQKKSSFFLPDSKICRDTDCRLERYQMQLIGWGLRGIFAYYFRSLVAFLL